MFTDNFKFTVRPQVEENDIEIVNQILAQS